MGGVFALAPPTGSGGPWTESVLHSFAGGPDGSYALAGVVIGTGGVLYGATAAGGPANAGTVFSLTPPKSAGGAWIESVLYAFTGGSPGVGNLSGLAVGDGGVLYGTTEGGGTGPCPRGCGTVFAFTPPAAGLFGTQTWTASVLYPFTGGSDGASPAGVAIGSNGVLYGTAGGGSCTPGAGQLPGTGCGVVFSLTPPSSPGGAWTETVLHTFSNANGTCNPFIGCFGYTDGFYPSAGVAIGKGGILYGTTQGGGPANGGTLYSVTPPADASGAWTESVLYNFTGYSAYYYPISAQPSVLVIGADGTLYGTTAIGGNGTGGPYCPEGCGTVFSLTPPAAGLGGAWTESTIYSFIPGYPDLQAPTSGVAIGSGGVLYGAAQGGSSYQGGLFSLSPPSAPGGDWAEAVLYNLTGNNNWGYPSGVAICGGPGVLYGATPYGGSGQCTAGGFTGCGTVFALIPPPSPDGVWSEATLYNFTGASDGAFPHRRGDRQNWRALRHHPAHLIYGDSVRLKRRQRPRAVRQHRRSRQRSQLYRAGGSRRHRFRIRQLPAFVPTPGHAVAAARRDLRALLTIRWDGPGSSLFRFQRAGKFSGAMGIVRPIAIRAGRHAG